MVAELTESARSYIQAHEKHKRFLVDEAVRFVRARNEDLAQAQLAYESFCEAFWALEELGGNNSSSPMYEVACLLKQGLDRLVAVTSQLPGDDEQVEG